jgi:hypothetical protein
MMNNNVLIVSLLIAMFVISCSGGKMEVSKTTLPSIKDVPVEAWQKLSQKKIYFGHQSVGFNIIDGIKDVMKENPQIKLNIVESSNPSDFTTPLIAHSRVGKNTDPQSKCDAFADVMEMGLGDKTDIAFFKFCYVDIFPDTDVNRVFAEYKKTMSALRSKYPRTTFVHFTIPLTVLQTGPKAWVKKIIGRPINGYDDNIKREQFNEKLRKEYNGREPIFDLSTIESTTPEGLRATFQKDGKLYPYLVTDYTDDGGHLNGQGRCIVAEQLLIFLANIANK